MKKLNELVTKINVELNNDASYIKLVFDLLMIFFWDFGLDSLLDYFPRIANQYAGEYFRTFWYQDDMRKARETLDYGKITMATESKELTIGQLKLGHMLEVGPVDYRFTITPDDIGNREVEEAFEREWKCLFENKQNQFLENIVRYLNQGVYDALIRVDPSLKRIFPIYKDFEERGSEYRYEPSETAIKEAEEILEKLRR